MPAPTEAPTVSLSFANNFWGKDDAGYTPLLERMHNAKVSNDELKAFYTARAAIEEEYARKLLSLARKPLGSGESGTLRMSLDVTRREVESMAKAHAHVASQMKTELEEPLAAFAAGMKERRKIVQSGIEKLHKMKSQQTSAVNKSRDRYEQDCLKIKGYLAQGHMVMGQEERKINAKLEKTKIQVSSTSTEYEAAVKALEETTGRWNRDWKAACDKFQDLEEERIDYAKSSLWSFANIASTVCVSDDASCEKIRLSLEDCEVEKDICSFIRVHGTGQEIPDPPKFIDFCRGDVENGAEHDETSYSVAQFQRPLNPAMRTSSPQPSILESHHDPHSALARELGGGSSPSAAAPQASPGASPHDGDRAHQPAPAAAAKSGPVPYGQKAFAASWVADAPKVPHNEYPQDGMTQFCRPGGSGPPSSIGALSSIGAPSDLGSNLSSNVSSNVRPPSRDSQSEYSALSYADSHLQQQQPQQHRGGATRQAISRAASPGPPQQQHYHQAPPPQEEISTPSKSRSRSFFKSPFRRPSRPDNKLDGPEPSSQSSHHGGGGGSSSSPARPPNRNTWGAAAARRAGFESAGASPVSRRSIFGGGGGRGNDGGASASPEPALGAGAGASGVARKYQLNVGDNMFDVAPSPSGSGPSPHQARGSVNGGNASAVAADEDDPTDPLVQALDELNRVTSKATRSRGSADHYFNIPTPGPGTPLSSANNNPVAAAQRGTPPPQYEGGRPGAGSAPGSAHQTLGAPPAAHTAREMQAATSRYLNQRRSVFEPGGGGGHHRAESSGYGAGGDRAAAAARAVSPVPRRSVSPRPHSQAAAGRAGSSGGFAPRAVSPLPQQAWQQHPSQAAPMRGGGPVGGGSVSRPTSRAGGGEMALQLSNGPPSGGGGYGSARGRNGAQGRPVSGVFDGRGFGGGGGSGAGSADGRMRSRSVAEGRQYTKDGRAILHHARAMYMYQAQIPEELGFSKGDVLAVLRLQDDGWWEAEIVGRAGARGLVPSNYLQTLDR